MKLINSGNYDRVIKIILFIVGMLVGLTLFGVFGCNSI